MITDEEVAQAFSKRLDVPDIVTAMSRMKGRPNPGFQLNRNLSLQVSRGMAMQSWEGAPPAGCVRHMAVFNTFGVIPEYCFGCYKVLISPRTVLELFKLLLVYERLALPNNNTRKCMIDVRSYTSAGYKGFVYCRGLDDAGEVCRIIREATEREISPGVPVTIKHGCSEYAMVYPEFAVLEQDTGKMSYGNGWKFYEDFADEAFVFDKIPAQDTADEPSGSLGELFALQYWLRYAATKGDMSYLVITGGKALEPLPQQ